MQVILCLSLHLVQKKDVDSPTAKISATLSHLDRLPAKIKKAEETLPYIKKKIHTETEEEMTLLSFV